MRKQASHHRGQAPKVGCSKGWLPLGLFVVSSLSFSLDVMFSGGDVGAASVMCMDGDEGVVEAVIWSRQRRRQQGKRTGWVPSGGLQQAESS